MYDRKMRALVAFKMMLGRSNPSLEHRLVSIKDVFGNNDLFDAYRGIMKGEGGNVESVIVRKKKRLLGSKVMIIGHSPEKMVMTRPETDVDYSSVMTARAFRAKGKNDQGRFSNLFQLDYLLNGYMNEDISLRSTTIEKNASRAHVLVDVDMLPHTRDGTFVESDDKSYTVHFVMAVAKRADAKLPYPVLKDLLEAFTTTMNFETFLRTIRDAADDSPPDHFPTDKILSEEERTKESEEISERKKVATEQTGAHVIRLILAINMSKNIKDDKHSIYFADSLDANVYLRGFNQRTFDYVHLLEYLKKRDHGQ